MKGLSIKQPWLYLIAKGIKTIETRVWNTNYRGDVLLCSSKSPIIMNFDFYKKYNIDKNDILMKDGYALAIATIKDCKKMVKEDKIKACCDIYENAHSIFLENIRLIEPFAIKGNLKLFNLSDEIKDKIKES